MASKWFVGRDREPNIEIPDSERLPLPPSIVLQGQFLTWLDSVSSRLVPNLRGRTLEEVKQGARRVKFGNFFPSFDAFDHCLNSWAVLSGRGAHILATKYKYRVRVCKYGPVVIGNDGEREQMALKKFRAIIPLTSLNLILMMAVGEFPGHDGPGNVVLECEDD